MTSDRLAGLLALILILAFVAVGILGGIAIGHLLAWVVQH